FSYRTVGVVVQMTPRVTFEGDVILDLTVENSTRGQDVNIAGTNLPSFGSRRVQTRLRLRDGESNLLAGLLRETDRKFLRGVPGILNVPVLRSLFAHNDRSIEQTDIVMLLTPRIVRTQELTPEDVAPIFIGTQQSLGLSGPPPLIAPPADNAVPAAPAAPGAAQPAVPPAPAPGTTPPASAPSGPGAPGNLLPSPGTTPQHAAQPGSGGVAV